MKRIIWILALTSMMLASGAIKSHLAREQNVPNNESTDHPASTGQSGTPPGLSRSSVERPVNEDLRGIEARINALEAGRTDLSAWATLFIGIVTVILAANIALSAAQVSSLAHREVAKLISKYDSQFSGFLTENEQTVTAKLEDYERMIKEISERLVENSAAVRRYAADTSQTAKEIQEQSARTIEQLRAEGERLRDTLRSV